MRTTEELAADLKSVFEHLRASIQSAPPAWVDIWAEHEDNRRLIGTGEIRDLPFVEVPWP